VTLFGPTGTVEATAEVPIQNAAPVVTIGLDLAADQGTPVTATATFSDIGFDFSGTVKNFTATIDWGDGTTSSGTVNVTPGGLNTPTTGTVSGTHTYRRFGTFPVTIQVADEAGVSGTATLTATIANVAPTVAPISAGTYRLGQEFLLNGLFGDAGRSDLHTVTIDWGDGNVVTFDSSSFAQAANGDPIQLLVEPTATEDGRYTLGHIYAGPGDYTITVTVTDDGGLSATTTRLITNAPGITAVTTTTADGSYRVGANINVTVNFSRPVTLAGGSLTLRLNTGSTVTIAPFANATSATGVYTVLANETTADLDLAGPISLDAGATLLDAFNVPVDLSVPTGASLSAGATIVIDTLAPTATLSSSVVGPTRATSVPVWVLFSEPVTGFTPAGLILDNATVANFVAVNDTTYTFDLLPRGDGVASVTLAEGAALDRVGNPSTNSAVLRVTIDTVAPMVTIQSVLVDRAAPQFGGTINDPTATIQVTLGGQTLTATNNGDGTWSLVNGPTLADGTYQVAVIATDLVGNVSAPATTELTIDTIPPRIISITTPAGGRYRPGDEIPITIVFDEPVTLTGELLLPLVGGGFVRFTSFNGTQATGVYVVAPGQSVNGLQISGPAQLANGATLRDAAGNALLAESLSGRTVARDKPVSNLQSELGREYAISGPS